MSVSAATLRQKLELLESVAGKPARHVLAFSGGLDSTVLLHALAVSRRERDTPLIALHVDHGLQSESAAWSEHCRRVAADFGVAFDSLSVTVQLESGKGPEASARDARYAALHAELSHGDWLISAHHREDQAETLLLNLVRGSGPMGIAGIAAVRRFGPGWLARPLLETSRAELRVYADSEGLRWLEDPTNRDRRFDRNFLRHEILPRLKTRWPDIAARLQRSAAHAGAASRLLSDLAKIDLDRLQCRPDRLPIDRLLELPPDRQKNLLRYALRYLGLSTPTSVQLSRVLDELIPAREDAQPLVQWPGAAVRRYRNALYLLPEHPAATAATISVTANDVPLGTGLGVLQFVKGAPSGIAESYWRRGIEIRFRDGGEQFHPAGQLHTRKLKKLLQEEGIVPWMRDRVPLVYAGDELVAVADLWIASAAVGEPGVAVRWSDRPALH